MDVNLQKMQFICLAILAGIAVGVSLFYLKTVLLPFVIAIFVVSGCRPILEYLERRLHLHWFIAFGITFFIGLLLSAVFALFTWLSIYDLAQNSSQYDRRVKAIFSWVSDQMTPDEAEHPPGDRPPAPPTTQRRPVHWALAELLDFLAQRSQQSARDIANALTGLMSSFVLVMIIVFFLLLDRASPTRKNSRTFLMIDRQIREFIVLKTVISVLTGFAFGLVLWFFGIPLAVVFGMLAFLLNYIPNLGPVIASLLPLPFLILNPETSIGEGMLIFGLGMAVQFLSGNVIEPKIMGDSFNVHPVVLLFALLFWGLVWGIVGMFLATPITSVIRIVLDQNSATRPWADLMAGDLAIIDKATQQD